MRLFIGRRSLFAPFCQNEHGCARAVSRFVPVKMDSCHQIHGGTLVSIVTSYWFKNNLLRKPSEQKSIHSSCVFKLFPAPALLSKFPALIFLNALRQHVEPQTSYRSRLYHLTATLKCPHAHMWIVILMHCLNKLQHKLGHNNCM